MTPFPILLLFLIIYTVIPRSFSSQVTSRSPTKYGGSRPTLQPTFSFLSPLPPPFDPALGPFPPLQPMECSAERQLVVNNFILSSGEQITKINMAGFKYFSLYNRATYLIAGGNEHNIPSSQIVLNMYNMADNSPLSSHKIDFVNQKCVNMGPDGANIRYEGYNYFQYVVSLLDQGMDQGIQVYYGKLPCIDPQNGLCVVYAWEMKTSDTDPKAILRTSVYFSDKSPNYMLYLLIEGIDMCCQDGSGCKQNSTQVCADGIEPVPTSRYELETYTNYIKYSDDYVWPEGFFNPPACPVSYQISNSDVNKAPAATPTTHVTMSPSLDADSDTPAPTSDDDSSSSSPPSSKNATPTASAPTPCNNSNATQYTEEIIITACLVPTLGLLIFSVCYFCVFWAPKLVVEQHLDTMKLHAHTLATLHQKSMPVAPDATSAYNQQHNPQQFEITKNEMHL